MLFQARASIDALFGLVRPGAFHDRPVPERHRTIFYFAHLEAFDWNLLTKQQEVRHSIRNSTNSSRSGSIRKQGSYDAHMADISLVGTTNLMSASSLSPRLP
jgi:hypothetical protein